ncbi:LysR family transcriptional regulator [Rhodanobacter sp. 7MK24]|uniref:LysR substrate-binding domain-containing protein n=1 Tax=Rhodanobacter sp. 7MK24 TaxID=2775922 RepID=UPI00177BB61E|nr:LysR substrate-binding domain-containing protein [Rhodanobacter sp. 7MK24]MBD8879836.1 LysR family transcriptional regulator [Rhodanobacter sp. 7MK24]
MKYLLPPMHTLRTFEALGRLLHFAHAADELHLTTSAVSHQIRALESFYGTKLFHRGRRGVSLTAAGEALLAVVKDVLRQLSTAGEAIRTRPGQRLRVTAPPSLASRWLVPRLGDFLRGYPMADFQLRSTLELVELGTEEVDLGIRYGGGRWPGMSSEQLFGEEIFPVATSAYARQKKLRDASDLSRGLLLQDDFQSWADWFAQAEVVVAGCRYGPVFNDSALLLQAAEAGQGVALARSRLVVDAMAAGSLVRIGGLSIVSRESYYLVSPADRPDSELAAAFRKWLHQLADA